MLRRKRKQVKGKEELEVLFSKVSQGRLLWQDDNCDKACGQRGRKPRRGVVEDAPGRGNSKHRGCEEWIVSPRDTVLGIRCAWSGVSESRRVRDEIKHKRRGRGAKGVPKYTRPWWPWEGGGILLRMRRKSLEGFEQRINMIWLKTLKRKRRACCGGCVAHSLRRGKGGGGYISKAEPPGFAGGLDVECEGKKDTGFGPSSGRNGISHVLRLGEEQVWGRESRLQFWTN